MTIQLRPQGMQQATISVQQAIADCDMHPNPKSLEDSLFPFLEKRWQEHIKTYGMLERTGFQHGRTYPKAQPAAARRDAFPPDGGPPGSDLDFMRKQHLDPQNVKLGVLVPLRPGQGLQNLDLSAAICRAVNDWQLADWLTKEPRLKGSVVIPYQDPVASVAEIERRAGDPHFVQVSVLSRTPEPLGNRFYWPICQAAQDAGLPLAVHAFGTSGWPVTASGWPSYYIEEMLAHAQSCQSLLTSMIFEGVFERFPKLKLLLIEGGLAWLPTLAWRLDSLWEKLRGEVPNVKRKPSEYIREHVWITTQPIEEPKNRSHLGDIFDWIGWNKILFATDYPHWDFDDPAHALPMKMSKEQREGILINNALEFYGIKNPL